MFKINELSSRVIITEEVVKNFIYFYVFGWYEIFWMSDDYLNSYDVGSFNF